MCLNQHPCGKPTDIHCSACSIEGMNCCQCGQEISRSPNRKPLTNDDKLVLRFVDKQPRDMNWIKEIIFRSWANDTKKHDLLSKRVVENSLRKLTRHGLIQTEKYYETNTRVYFKKTKSKRGKQN